VIQAEVRVDGSLLDGGAAHEALQDAQVSAAYCELPCKIVAERVPSEVLDRHRFHDLWERLAGLVKYTSSRIGGEYLTLRTCFSFWINNISLSHGIQWQLTILPVLTVPSRWQSDKAWAFP